MIPEQDSRLWYLEGFLRSSEEVAHVHIDVWPFRLGRRQDLELTIHTGGVSALHAQFERSPEGLTVRDLGSKNGTFVNSVRVESEAELVAGDIVHLAALELRVACLAEPTPPVGTRPMVVSEPTSVFRDADHMKQLIAEKAVTSLYQPIVPLGSGKVVGFESLGRGTHSELVSSPVELLSIAGATGMELELSTLFRDCSLKEFAARGGALDSNRLFINAHPNEPAQPEFRSETIALARRYSELTLVVEIHERSILDPVRMRDLQLEFAEHGVETAFDDFGAGEARLEELVACAPTFIKFDRRLIGGGSRSWPRTHLLKSLVRIAHDLGSQPVAEGVETQAEAEMCKALGFPLAQGYFFGRPTTIENLIEAPSVD